MVPVVDLIAYKKNVGNVTQVVNQMEWTGFIDQYPTP